MIHESPGLNPDWFGEIRLLEVKDLNISLKISLSKILPQIGRRETGREFLIFCLSIFLWKETMLPFFHSEGKTPVRRACVEIISSGSYVESPHILSIRMLMLS